MQAEIQTTDQVEAFRNKQLSQGNAHDASTRTEQPQGKEEDETLLLPASVSSSFVGLMMEKQKEKEQSKHSGDWGRDAPQP